MVVRARGCEGVLLNAVFWTGLGHCSYALTVVVVTCTREGLQGQVAVQQAALTGLGSRGHEVESGKLESI